MVWTGYFVQKWQHVVIPTRNATGIAQKLTHIPHYTSFSSIIPIIHKNTEQLKECFHSGSLQESAV